MIPIKCQCGRQLEYFSNGVTTHEDKSIMTYINAKCQCGLFCKAIIKDSEIVMASYFKL